MIVEACLLILLISTTFIVGLAKLLNVDLKIVNFAKCSIPILCIIFSIRAFAYEIVLIQSDSMQPTLFAGDIVLIDKFSYGLRVPIIGKRLTAGVPKRAEIAIYRSTIHNYPIALIKRVVGVAGDQIAYKNRTLYIDTNPTLTYSVKNEFTLHSNGKPELVLRATELIDNQAHLVQFAWEQPSDPFSHQNILVQPKTYFMIGDYRDNSYDSRDSGLVNDQALIGRARYIAFSVDWLQKSIRWDRIGLQL